MFCRPPAAGCVRKKFLGNFLERQKAVALCAVLHECRLETRLYAGNSAFINIGFFLFPGRDLNR